MKNHEPDVLLEIKEMLRMISEDQKLLLKEMKELKNEQKQLIEEIRLHNSVMNGIPARNELLN